MHEGYYGISGNRLWLRGVLEPAMVRIDHDGAESLWARLDRSAGRLRPATADLDALLGETRGRREFAGLYEQDPWEQGRSSVKGQCPLPVAPGATSAGDGDGMLVEFASAVDAVTFTVGTRAARCLRFCETDPPCDGCFLIWKRRPSYWNR